jgi:hypothetical protein
MRYEVWKWDSDAQKQYEDDYGEGSYERDSQHPGCYSSITQYGVKIKETDDEIEASTACGDAFSSPFSTGDAAVWDTVEHYWFN